MFYITKDNELIIYDDDRAKLETTKSFMPQLDDEEIRKTTKITAEEIQEQPNKFIVKNGVLVLNPNYDAEQAAKREADFNKSFFLTSLGYVRRSVTMADGTHKDFLSDLLPVISMGVQGGQAVNILTYDKPPFDSDVIDWTEYQHQVVVTPQFIQECFMQLSNDFLPINEGAE